MPNTALESTPTLELMDSWNYTMITELTEPRPGRCGSALDRQCLKLLQPGHMTITG
jgi:hypothetical protein